MSAPKNNDSKLASNRQIVVVNQAANYLTIGFANAFNRKIGRVSLITGSVHEQEEALDPGIELRLINRWYERPMLKKIGSYCVALVRIWILLMTRYRHHEVLFVSVPPMGYLLNLLLPHRFSMIIWDVYPDVFRITGMSDNHPVYRFWARLNKLSFRKAWCLFTISQPMADSLSQYVASERIVVHPIWSAFHSEARIPDSVNPFIRAHNLQDKFVVQYSGNIGVTHNIESLIDIAEKLRDDSNIVVQIIGRGPRFPFIRNLVQSRSLTNVQMLPFQSDDMFPYSLSAADVGVVLLHESVGRGSVPSKAYNLMAFGIPSLYIASECSELARYAREFSHAECFGPQALESAADFIRDLAADKNRVSILREHALRAAERFQRPNADNYVRSYLAHENACR